MIHKKSSGLVRRFRPSLEQLEPRLPLAALTEVMVVGGVTESEAKVSLRTDTSSNVAIEYALNPDFSGSVRSSATATNATSDFTAIVEIAPLLPESQYFYRAVVDGAPVPSETGSFTTSPPLGSEREFRFAITADLRNTRSNPTHPAPAFATLAAEEPAFVLQIGDFDHRNPRTLNTMRLMHRDVRGGRGHAAGLDYAAHIAPSIPIYQVWDDHDYGIENGDKSFAGRASALRAFDEYIPTPDRPNPAGIWHSFRHAQAEFFMLDTRSQRDLVADPNGPDKSMLDGDNIANGQLEWLKEGMRNSTATWKFLVSSVPFNDTTKFFDGWSAYPDERQEILDFISSEDITGVVVLSGDLHTAGAIDDGTNAELPEFSIPHANLLTLREASFEPSGSWSEFFTPGTDGGGYGTVVVNADEVILEARAADGTLRGSYSLAAPDDVPNRETLLLTTTQAGTATDSNGSTVNFDDSDVLAATFDGSNVSYDLMFDGSDVGLRQSNEDLNAIHQMPNGDLLVSTARSGSVRADYASPNVGSGALISFTRQDLLLFSPTSLGADTSGSWSVFFRGSDHGLRANAENIDAVSVLDDGKILISTTGNARVQQLVSRDEDLIAFDPATNSWSIYMDGSDAGLTNSQEDVNAVALDSPSGDLPNFSFSTLGTFRVAGVNGTRGDVFTFRPTRLGPITAGTFDTELTFAAVQNGLPGGVNIDGASWRHAVGTASLRRQLLRTIEPQESTSAGVLTFDAAFERVNHTKMDYSALHKASFADTEPKEAALAPELQPVSGETHVFRWSKVETRASTLPKLKASIHDAIFEKWETDLLLNFYRDSLFLA